MPAKKKSARKTATKTSAGAASPGKTASKKAPGKKAPGKKAPGKKAPTRTAPAKTASAKKAPAKKAAAKAQVSSLSVNMGHVFALRPRCNTSFRPGDLATAKHQLQDESYASVAEAARAVAERALELTHDSGSRVGTRHDRR